MSRAWQNLDSRPMPSALGLWLGRWLAPPPSVSRKQEPCLCRCIGNPIPQPAPPFIIREVPPFSWTLSEAGSSLEVNLDWLPSTLSYNSLPQSFAANVLSRSLRIRVSLGQIKACLSEPHSKELPTPFFQVDLTNLELQAFPCRGMVCLNLPVGGAECMCVLRQNATKEKTQKKINFRLPPKSPISFVIHLHLGWRSEGLRSLQKNPPLIFLPPQEGYTGFLSFLEMHGTSES